MDTKQTHKFRMNRSAIETKQTVIDIIQGKLLMAREILHLSTTKVNKQNTKYEIYCSAIIKSAQKLPLLEGSISPSHTTVVME